MDVRNRSGEWTKPGALYDGGVLCGIYTASPQALWPNTTIQHALDNGLFIPKPATTRAVHVGTTETVEIKAVRERPTKVSVPLAEALLDRKGVLDIRIRRGRVDIVCRSRGQLTPFTRPNGFEPCQSVDRRLQRALARILSSRVAKSSSAGKTSYRKRRLDDHDVAATGQKLSRVRGPMSSSVYSGIANKASSADAARVATHRG